MKIAYFSLGETRHDTLFVTSLRKTEHPTGMFSFRGWSGKWLEWVLPKKQNTFIENMFRMPQQVRNLKSMVNAFAPDVVHAGPLHGTAFRLALGGVRPLVVLSWGSDLMQEAGRNLATKWITRFTLSRTDVLCGDSDCLYEKAKEFGYKGPYFKFPWGVDLETFSSGSFKDLRERLGWQENPILVSVRSHESLYNVDCIIKAFILAEKERPELRLLIYGGGTRTQILRDALKGAGILHKVYFGGQAPEERIIEAYRSADLYVAATNSDGASVSLMEGMACGLPALVSDIPGNREWIEPGKNGWLFKSDSAEDMAQYLVKFDRDSEEVKQMRLRNRAVAEERADWNKNFPVLLQAYEKAIALRRGQA